MSEPSRQVTWARAVIRRRGWVLAGVAALTAALASQAVKVRPDYSVELLFPVWDPARKVYDRFKAEFPYEDTRAVVIVEGRGLLERDALGRLKSLEADLARTPSVDEVIGPTSARTVTMEVDGPRLLPLLPGPEVDDARLAYARKVLSTDPLFARNVVGPDGGSVSIVLRLDPKVAGTDEGRQRISHDLRAVLDRHGDLGDRRILSGVPALRASFAAMIARDAGTLVPLALLAVTVLLALAFRDVRAVAAGLLTILLSLAWSYGVLGALGYPISMMVSVLPIIVMIICVSDTVHLIHHFLGERRAGQPPREAAALALADSAIPCLLTEIVVACGFASLVAVNITAILQFGVAAAISVLLVWVANVTILPVVLSFLPGKAGAPEPAAAPARAPWVIRRLDALTAWIAVQLDRRPARVVGIAAALLLASVAAGTRISTVSYVFDDLRPGSALAQELRAAERAHGGVLPIALYIETEGEPGAALDPDLVRLADRGAAMMRAIPEIGHAVSLGDFVRHASVALGGSSDLGEVLGRPGDLKRQLNRLDDPRLLDDVLSRDRRALAVQARVMDCGSECVEKIFAHIDGWIASEQAALDARPGPRAHVYATSQARIFKDVNDALMSGLLGSFAGSLLVSFVVMCLLLRSWRLGVIGIIPNVAPVLLVLGFMAALDIALKPVTVVLFSITLVIAEDDTIQLLSRLKGHYAAARAAAQPGEDPHRTAAMACMREVALPMLLTTFAVSSGFLLLMLSSFLGPAHLGLLIGATLLAAVLADLFLTPLLVIWLKPFAPRGAKALRATEVSA
ncbi:MAG TPA: MMPL family transporter [Myxococcaceae bacterium]|nr:MMPL family transporter [Myxococcaceae bacterium]